MGHGQRRITLSGTMRSRVPDELRREAGDLSDVLRVFWATRARVHLGLAEQVLWPAVVALEEIERSPAAVLRRLEALHEQMGLRTGNWSGDGLLDAPVREILAAVRGAPGLWQQAQGPPVRRAHLHAL